MENGQKSIVQKRQEGVMLKGVKERGVGYAQWW